MPPAWDPAIKEGAELATGTGTWYAIEVRDDIIWWARTRYGRAEACSAPSLIGGTPMGQYWLPNLGGGPGGIG